MNSAEIVRWLESPEGERWSRHHHNSGLWKLVTIKDRDEATIFVWYCMPWGDDGTECQAVA